MNNVINEYVKNDLKNNKIEKIKTRVGQAFTTEGAMSMRQRNTGPKFQIIKKRAEELVLYMGSDLIEWLKMVDVKNSSQNQSSLTR